MTSEEEEEPLTRPEGKKELLMMRKGDEPLTRPEREKPSLSMQRQKLLGRLGSRS